MGIEMRESQNSENTATREDLTNCTVVDQVTVEMILNDLAQGRSKEKIRQKYAYRDENGTPQPFEKWMVDEMFKDPNLRGKKPARKKVLPFTFKGTTNAPTPTPEPINNVPVTTTTMTAQSNGYVEINVEENDENNNQFNY